MVKSSKGIRARTRGIFTKRVRQRGLSPITRSLQQFEIGEKAHIDIDSSQMKGQPFARFHGLTGTVVRKQGRSYLLEVREGHKYKSVIASAEHLKKVKA